MFFQSINFSTIKIRSKLQKFLNLMSLIMQMLSVIEGRIITLIIITYVYIL